MERWATAVNPGRGLVAIGDSITRGSGEAMLGLRMQSWALWLAEALALPYTCLAEDGARAADALAHQTPRLAGPYDLGCVYVGVNDVRAPDWNSGAYRQTLDELMLSVRLHCRRLLVLQIPRSLGRPPAPPAAIDLANVAIAETAASHGALVLAPRGLHGPALVMPDAVHLTARGEAHVALLAAVALSAAGMPSEQSQLREALAQLPSGSRLRYVLGARGIAQLRDWRRRALESLARALERAT